MGDGYLWIKVLHLLAVISWMAGLFYLPRLMVYHAGCAVESETSEVFKVMERRLLRAIMRPAGVVSWVMGIWLGLRGGWFAGGIDWLWLKVGAVAGLTVVHLMLERHVYEFAGDRRVYSGRYFRVLNEVPTVLLIVIVVLAVVKPL